MGHDYKIAKGCILSLSLYGAFAVFGDIALCIESALSNEVQGVA
jgi:hypothetical protein